MKFNIAFIVLNIVILVLGLLLLCMGLWAILNEVEIINLAQIDDNGLYGSFSAPGMLETVAYMSIFAGVVMASLAVLAFFGVKKDSKWMLSLYAGLLVIVLILMVIMVALTVVVRGRVESDLHSALWQGIVTRYYGVLDTADRFSEYYDYAQVEFSCCGIYSYTDFKQNATNWLDRYSNEIPKTCCKLDKYIYTYEREYVFESGHNCTKYPSNANSNINKQCYDDIKDALMTKTYVLMAVVVVAAFAQLIGIICGCCLARRVKDDIVRDYSDYIQ